MDRLNKILIILLLTVVFGITCVYAAEYSKFSRKFIKAMGNCDKYNETTESEFEGGKFTTSREILGWRNSFCLYRETWTTKDAKYQLDCTFTPFQIEDLYDSMKSRSKEVIRFDLDLFADQIDPKTGKTKYVNAGTTTISGNKAFVTWAKYQNNPYFCSRKKL